MMIWMSNVSADKNSPGWQLHEGEGMRIFPLTVTFAKEMPSKPAVIVSLTHIDASDDYNLRVQVEVDNATTTGWNGRFVTWGDSQIFGLGASWIAIAF